jgi:hypothetical protein
VCKSIGKETTFSEEIEDIDQMLEILDDIAVKFDNSLMKRDTKGRTITLRHNKFFE